jgi:hypothetical protein
VGFGADFGLGFCAAAFFPVVDFWAVDLDAFAFFVEAAGALGLFAFPDELGFFLSAIPVDLTCWGDYSTFGLSNPRCFKARSSG